MLSLGSFYLILLPLVFSDQYTKGYWFINIGTVLHFFIQSGMFSWSRHSLKWLLIRPYKAVKFLSQNWWRNSGHAFPVGHFHYLFHFSYSDFDFLLFVVLMFPSFQFMKPFMRIMILICLCRKIVQQKLLSLISSQIHCQKLSLCQSPPNFGQDLTYVEREFRLW